MGVAVFPPAGGRFGDAHPLAGGAERRLGAQKIIISAGGHARRLLFPGSGLALTHSDVWSMASLPHSIAIVGGAATGCQLASVFAAFGASVHLLEVGSRPLGVEDEAISLGIRQAFERRGIAVLTQIGGIKRIERAAGTLRLVYRPGGTNPAVQAEALLLAGGWPANTQQANL